MVTRTLLNVTLYVQCLLVLNTRRYKNSSNYVASNVMYHLYSITEQRFAHSFVFSFL
jgi:hypothetical protein